MRKLTVLCLLVAAAVAAAGDPAKPDVRWPKIPAPAPAPPATPTAVDRLAADRWFVIDSDVELLILDSPANRLEKAVEAGPFKARGKFADGGDAVETRTYRGKFIYFLEVKKGATAGPVELFVAPTGATKEADFVRRTLQVGGATPGPAPGPDVPDGPEPSDPLFKPLKAAYERAKDPVALGKLLKVYQAAAETDLRPFATAGQLRTALKDKVRQNDLSEDALRGVREVIQKELEQFLPLQPDAALTQDSRANAKGTFVRIVTCLEALR